jgi:hypothetical protein
MKWTTSGIIPYILSEFVDHFKVQGLVLMSQGADLLNNDFGATPSKLGNTSLSAVLMRLQNS